MGILSTGILGSIRGKVAGVVGGQWKDKNYLRGYAVPANPNTASQQVQRNLFKGAVAFAQLILGQILNVYVDPFQKTMSGFNYFIKKNISEFIAIPLWTNIMITFGKLSHPTITLPPLYLVDHYVVAFNTNYGANGKAADKVFGLAYNATLGIMYFAAAEVARSTVTINIDMPEGDPGDTIAFWIFAASYDPAGNLDMVSDSVCTTLLIP